MHVMYLISCVWFSTYFISIHVPMVYQYHITIHSAELCWNPESVRFIGPRFQPLRFRRWKKRNSESTRANGPCAAPPPPNWRIQAGWAASNVARIRHGPLQNTTCFTAITKKKLIRTIKKNCNHILTTTKWGIAACCLIKGWHMFINREGPTQSSTAIFFGMWVLVNSGMIINMNLTLFEVWQGVSCWVWRSICIEPEHCEGCIYPPLGCSWFNKCATTCPRTLPCLETGLERSLC